MGEAVPVGVDAARPPRKIDKLSCAIRHVGVERVRPVRPVIAVYGVGMHKASRKEIESNFKS